jgi:hypothetical protein
MPTVNLSALAGAGQQFFDNNGNPLTGGKLYSYAAGTTTPQTTYTSASGATAHTNPIILDSAGRVATGEIWVTAGQNYKFVLKTSTEVTLATWDNITGIGGTGIATNAEFVTYDPPFTNAVATNVEAKLAQTVSVKDFGAVGNGVVDDTVAIQAAIDAIAALGGGYIYFTTGTYKVTESIILKNGCGLVSDNSAEIYAPAVNFNNTDLSITNRYGTNAVVINASGLTTASYTPISNVSIKNLKITSEVTDGRVVRAIAARNVVNLKISGCEISGFPVGCGICLATISGASFINNNYVHDFTSNAVWTSLPQITAIEVDNDVINSIATVDLDITGNNIRNITVGATIIASWGYQTDGINVARTTASRVRITNNNIKNVGEGIDYFAINGVIANNTISDVYIFGIKLLHGASRNIVSNNNIENAGLAGITIQGSTIVGVGDTQWNIISSNVIDNIDASSVWAAASTSGILIADNIGTTGKPKNNTFVGNTVNLGVNGEYGWLDGSTGTNNIGTSLTIIPGAGLNEYVTITNGGGVVQLTGSSFYINRSNVQVISSASTIAPTSGFVYASGTTTINTITPPDFVISGQVSSITIIPTGAWVTGTSGNIIIASTAIPSRPITFTYVYSESKWYPSY